MQPSWRDLLHRSRTEHCHFLIDVTVHCERCGADSRLEQCRWTCDVLEGLSVLMGMGIVAKEAKICHQNSVENCDSARIGLGYNGQSKWKTTPTSCELFYLKERLSLPSALVSLGRCWGCRLLLPELWVLNEVIMSEQGLLWEQQGETDSEQCKRKEKAFPLPLLGVFSLFPPPGPSLIPISICSC